MFIFQNIRLTIKRQSTVYLDPKTSTCCSDRLLSSSPYFPTTMHRTTTATFVAFAMSKERNCHLNQTLHFFI